VFRAPAMLIQATLLTLFPLGIPFLQTDASSRLADVAHRGDASTSCMIHGTRIRTGASRPGWKFDDPPIPPRPDVPH
jgi:hypothetical protein